MILVTRYSLKLVKESNCRYDIPTKKFTGSLDVVTAVKAVYKIHECPEEKVIVLFLDTKNVLSGMSEISHGTLNACLMHPREVYKAAILANANAVIIVHNHPSGDTEPSNADKQVTEVIKQAGKLLQIDLLDHIIVGNGENNYSHFSFRENNLL